MTELEREIILINDLAEIWGQFLNLKTVSHSDNIEFMQGIHYLQEKLASREVFRIINQGKGHEV